VQLLEATQYRYRVVLIIFPLAPDQPNPNSGQIWGVPLGVGLRHWSQQCRKRTPQAK